MSQTGQYDNSRGPGKRNKNFQSRDKLHFCPICKEKTFCQWGINNSNDGIAFDKKCIFSTEKVCFKCMTFMFRDRIRSRKEWDIQNRIE